MSGPRDDSQVSLVEVLRRIDAAAAALPARPQTALRELQAARDELTARLDAADVTFVATATSDDVRLTMRERQVLHLLAAGDRNKEIALRLGLRERTIKFHVANVLAKLGAQSRTGALRRAIELDLLRTNHPPTSY